MGMTAAIAGASGFTGGELLRLVSAHPYLELGAVTASANAGATVTDVHPDLTELAGRVFEPTDCGRLECADVVFLALPYGESPRIAAGLGPAVKVVDLGNDFRITDAAIWESFWESAHAGAWCYGLPELPGRRERIAAESRVASPGCYATAVILALAPLVAAGLAEPSDIVVTAASGTSGVGKTVNARLRPGELLGAMRAYQVGGEHGTIPEIEQELAVIAGAPATVSFTPLLTSMPRGILASCSIRMTGAATTAELRGAIAATYRDEPFVRLLPEGRWPSPGAVAGSNRALLQAAADLRARRAVVLVTLDNLGKGGAGQAIQSANLMLGLSETAGLTSKEST